jgi:hypothetical protein
MSTILFWSIIIIAIIIIVVRVINLLRGKSDSCSCCPYKSNCKKYSDKKGRKK